MNQLSWLLYLAHVCGAIEALSVLGTLIVAFGLFIFIMPYVMADTSYNHKTKKYEKDREFPEKAINRLLGAAGVFSLLLVINPGSTTVYAIAASQFGEQLMKTKIAGKAEQALEAWLDKQIKGDTEGKKQ